jgi:hypothetical protein
MSEYHNPYLSPEQNEEMRSLQRKIDRYFMLSILCAIVGFIGFATMLIAMVFG